MDINRATLSKYETGIIEPTISQLVRIAEELEISPTVLLPISIKEPWESGKDYGSDESIQKILGYGYRISDDEINLIRLYWSLNANGQHEAVKRVEELTEIPRYRRQSAPEPPVPAPPDVPEGRDTNGGEKPTEGASEGE